MLQDAPCTEVCMFHGDVDPSRRTLFCVVDRASNKHTMLLIASELEFDLRPLLAS